MTQKTTSLAILVITVRSGLIEDIDSTAPVRVVVEDWDVPDWDTGKRPTRSLYQLDGALSYPKAEKLLRMLINE